MKEIYRGSEQNQIENNVYSPIYLSEHYEKVKGRQRRTIHLTLNIEESGIYQSVIGAIGVDLSRLDEDQAVIGITSDLLKGVQRGVNKKQPEVLDVYISHQGRHGARDLNPKTRLSIYHPGKGRY